ATFAGKALIDDAAKAAGLAWLVPLLVIAAALTGGSVLNAAGRVTFGWGPPPAPAGKSPAHEQRETEGRDLPFAAVLPAVVLLVLAFGLGLIRNAVPFAVAAGARFADRGEQLRVVLGGIHPSPLPAAEAIPLAEGVVWGCISAAVAVGTAAFALFAQRSSGARSALHTLCARAIRPLRALHSGVVTDYVAWLATGMATFGTALALLIR
ncbi:MAG: hypothetical protein ABR591_07550, partial [Candidatus Velthaea sp.]